MVLDGNAVRSVDRAAALLLALGDAQGEAGVDGDSLLTVAQADGPNLIAVGDWTGRSVPLHCVASGKVLMAALAEREVLRIVRRGLVAHTDRTITELEPLLEELSRIAAVDIWGPAFRLTPRRIPELAVQVREAAAAISVRLGGAAA